MENEAKKIADEILRYVDDKPVMLGSGILLDWVERLQNTPNTPIPVQGEIIGDVTLDLNSIGEISISTKYSDTTFIVESNQIQEFIQKFSKLEKMIEPRTNKA